MRYLIFVTTLICLLILCACGGGKDRGDISVGNGRLVKWSDQQTESNKKIIFVHSFYRDIEDPHGLTLFQMESAFSPKLENLDSLGLELFGVRTTERVEYWFYGYQPSQSIDKIADDLAELIQNNSNFDNSQIAIVGYSQGGTVAWLLDQRHDLIDGGVILGAPILSTPLAHKDVRDEAMREIFPVLGNALIGIFDDWAIGTDQLATDYPEQGIALSDLLFMVGYIDPPATDVLTRNCNLIDVLASNYDSYVGNAGDDRQLMEVGAVIINYSDWDDAETCYSDGVVPVSSGWMGNRNSVQVWEDYDHSDLLSGKGDLSLDRATLQHLGLILDLFPKFVEADLPILPELEIHLGSESSVWDWAKFVYVQDGKLFLTDEDWSREILVTHYDHNFFPRFHGENLIWTAEIEGQLCLYFWQDNGITQVSAAGSRCANFSPDGEKLIYQYGNDLTVYNLESEESWILVENTNLIGPAIWQEGSFLSQGKIYFTAEVEGRNNLYSIASNSLEVSLSNTELLVQDCSLPFIAANPINGIAVVSNEGDTQSITIVTSGIFVSHIIINIRQSDDSNYQISGTTEEINLYVPDEFVFSQAVFDPEYGHLYLIADSGLWLLDINRILQGEYVSMEEIFYLVKREVESLDIKLTNLDW